MKVTILNQEHNIKLYDWSDVITEQHNKDVCKLAQIMFNNGEHEKEDPLFRSVGNPFEDKPDETWKIMKHTFHASCADYIGKPYKILATQSRVTSMSQQSCINTNPDAADLDFDETVPLDELGIGYTDMWHDHVLEDSIGSAVTGVWFLGAPEELIATGRAGTKFAFNWPDVSDVSFIGPHMLSWIIFPNTLWHAPGDLHATLPRFILSADLEYMLL
jgi:hypothetical protein